MLFVSLALFIFFLHLLQRAHLLDNTEKLERSSRRLEAGYQIAVETGTYSVLDWVRREWGGVGQEGGGGIQDSGEDE